MQDKLLIQGINGPVVTVPGKTELSMMEEVYVGKGRLIGEVIGITDAAATIQVYENTTSLRPGEPVERTGYPMRCMLAPGLLTGIYDGIGRPLDKIEERTALLLAPGSMCPRSIQKKPGRSKSRLPPATKCSRAPFTLSPWKPRRYSTA